MPLSMTMSNKEVTIVNINGSAGLKHRLNELGLVRGSKITVIQPSRGGSMIIKVLNSKLVLNRSTAHNVIVA